MVDNTVYEPLKMFENKYKHEVEETAIDTLNELIKKSKVDEAENEMLVKKYQKALDESNEADKILSKYHNIKIFINVLVVLLICVGVFMLYTHTSTLYIVLGSIFIVIAIGLIIYNIQRINKIIKHRAEISDELNKKEKEALNACYAQVAPLLDLFDFNMASNIVEKACPMIQMDDYFNSERLQLLIKHFGYKPDNDPKTSSILVQSGTLNENPFIVLRNRVQGTRMQTFQGTRLITWTETYTDSDGHTHTRTRTQTLVATVSKPVPNYYNETYLVYGNEAGSNLKFSRKPTYFNRDADQKEIDKYVRKHEDDLEKYAEKQANKGRNFTPLSNSEFEILFNALDRNNDVEFRLLFTPLAQNNEVDLITKNKYYGDDFTFRKYGPINYLHSEHIQSFDLSQDPRKYYSFNIKQIRTNFTTYVNDYFRNVYFELAPLLAIPIYQQHSPSGWVYDDSLFNNFPEYVDEVMANKFNSALLKPANAVTENIYKVKNVRKVGQSDLVTITADSFFSKKEVEFVPTLGLDGRLHNVSVFYDAYYPISKDTDIVLSHYHNDRVSCSNSINEVKEYLNKIGVNNVVYQAGLLSFIASNGFTLQDDMELEKIIGYNKDNLGGN